MKDTCRYLENTNLSTKEISEQLLFTNISFFCKALSHIPGTTPGNYKKINVIITIPFSPSNLLSLRNKLYAE